MRTRRVLIGNGICVAASALVVVVWLVFGSSFTSPWASLGTGRALASQEVISSFAGYLTHRDQRALLPWRL